MSQAFPELMAVWGEYRLHDLDEKEVWDHMLLVGCFWSSIAIGACIEPHAWCVDIETEEVVDPTAFQFPEGGKYVRKCDLLEATDDELAVAVWRMRNQHPDDLNYGELEENNTLLAFRVLKHLERDGPRARVGIRRRNGRRGRD
jgi:hypothetical protein